MNKLCRIAFAAVLLALAGTPVALAQSDESATERLVQILVKNGVLTKVQAEELAAQARAEARAARPPAAPDPAAPTQKPRPVAPGSVRVTYVPETVRKQIAAEVKQQVMQQATEEGWAEPNVIPGWTQRVRVSGDVRLRGQMDSFPRGNYNAFPDFNAINSTANGYDAIGGVNPPLLNAAQERTRMRLRARIGVSAKVADWVDSEIRIATGSDRGPVSTNQTLGAGGDFSKYSLWLDRAAITLRPDPDVTIYAGRSPNPFWTTDLLFDDDLNVDGLAAQGRLRFDKAFSGFLTLGGFPVFNTEFAFGSTNLAKTRSRDSWLLAAQLGADYKPEEQPYNLRIALGYFGFQNVEGKTSRLCVAPTSYGSCDTDYTRAAWLTYGNTVMPVRNIAATSGATTAQPQFYGLASRFGILELRGQATYTGFHPVDVRLDGEYAQNLAFDRQAIERRGPVNNIGNNGSFVGSNTGYMMRLTAGHLTLTEAGMWNVAFAYKYVGSDAVIDSLTDARFHQGGTNAKGFVLSGTYALARDIWLAGNWTSTNAVSGQPYSADTVLFDLNVRF